MTDPVLTPSEVLVTGLRLTESLRWHDDDLYYADVHAGTVFRLGLEGGPELVLDLGEAPGGIGWLPDGSMLVIAQESRRVMRLDHGALTVHADLSDTGSASLNDMWVDALGRAYVGDMGFDIHLFNRLAAEQSPEAIGLIRPGHVFVVQPDGSAQTATDEPLLFPNGIVGSPTGEVLVAESFGLKLTAFEVQPDGRFGAARTAAPLGFPPDGLSRSSLGTWVADPGGNRAVLVDDHGQAIREVTAEHKCLDIALGGPRDEFLYLATTAATDPAETAASPTARIERVRLT